MSEKTKVKATVKQKLAAKAVVDNGGNVTQAMITAGYSVATANTPQKLTESKGWQQLMDEYLGEDRLTRKHQRLLNQKRLDYFVFPKAMPDEEIEEHVNAQGIKVVNIRESDKGKMAFYMVDDALTQRAALDMAYKLRGSYAPEKTLNVNVEVQPSDDIKALADKLNGA